MTQFIRVQPARDNRVGFAQWAVAQAPKVRTVAPEAFAVPHHLFTGIPEPLLIGALVDGHRYVSPAEDVANGTPPPGAELTGVATAAAFAETGSETGPDLAEGMAAAAGGDSSGPDFADDSDSSDSHANPPSGDEGFVCDVCQRPFSTERGRDTHRRKAH